MNNSPGKVYLVGAGPGDPGLITLKGLRCLEQAQVVIYDRLMDPSLIDSAPPSAERIFVGKERGRRELTQDQINELLVDRGLAGKVVVRLKGGDPFVFGRGGEEALALTEKDIPFEVVPGITSSIAAAAYAGIPVTHRGIATCFTVVSGSEDPAKEETSVNWQALARTGGTLVVLMGWSALESILNTLKKEGVPVDTPVVLVQWGTWPAQAAVTGRLDDILERGRAAGIKAPVVTVIGPVVALREELAWFDRRPLFGKKVLITRSRTQASKFRRLLEGLGAQTFEIPSIQTKPLEDYAELDKAVAGLKDFRWVIFASSNAVEAVFDRLAHLGLDSRALGGVKVGAIGPATADVLAQSGITADFVPTRPVSEVVVQELSQRDWTGVPVLLPVADIGRDALATGLTEAGALVDRVNAYRTVPTEGVDAQAREALSQGIDAVTFTSSSTVTNLVNMLNGDRAALEASSIACIGPTTAATARELGLRVDLVADEHTVEGLADALVAHFAESKIVEKGSLTHG